MKSEIEKSNGGNEQLKDENNKLKEENSILKDENENAKNENNDLKSENTNLKEENVNLKEENANLKEENTNLKEENANLKEENANLKEENANLKEENARKCIFFHDYTVFSIPQMRERGQVGGPILVSLESLYPLSQLLSVKVISIFRAVSHKSTGYCETYRDSSQRGHFGA